MMTNFLKNSSTVLGDKLADVLPLSNELYQAFCKVDRALFVPDGFHRLAYELDALPISSNQWISSPLTVGQMTIALDPYNADSVLEIGCGSGYQAAILSKLFRRVFTIERIEKLYLETKKTFKKNGFVNVNLKYDDGQKGWKTYAPYDRILFSAYIKEIPHSLFAQLNEKGILVAPIGDEKEQIITKFTKKNGKIEEEKLQVCQFVPVLDGVEKLK